MKKLIALAATATFITTPAFAAKLTIDFAAEEGTQTWVLDSETDMATAPDGTEIPYTYDEEALELCGTTPDGAEMCVTFDEGAEVPEVGFSTGYTSSDGTTGTATITAITE